MDNNKITKDILALVDSSPLSEVNISEIVTEYTSGLEILQQQQVRGSIKSILVDLRKAGEIEFSDYQPSFTSLSQSMFSTSSFKIKGSYKRHKELEQIERDKLKSQLTHQATFNAPFTGNFTQGSGSPEQQFNEPKKTEKPKWLTWTFYWEETIKFGWKWLMVIALAALSTYLGVRSSKDKELDKPNQPQEQILPTVPTDTTGKKDSVSL